MMVTLLTNSVCWELPQTPPNLESSGNWEDLGDQRECVYWPWELLTLAFFIKPPQISFRYLCLVDLQPLTPSASSVGISSFASFRILSIIKILG